MACCYLTVQDFSWTQLKQVGGRRVTTYLATFILALAFYWWTPHVLPLGKITWGQLFPAAVATAVCMTGLGVFRPSCSPGRWCPATPTTGRSVW